MQYSLCNLWGSRRGRWSIPCGTCGAQGVVGAAPGVVGAVFPVGLKAW